MKENLVRVCNGKALQRKVAKAISQALQARDMDRRFYVDLHVDKGYSHTHSVREWAEFRFIYDSIEPKIDITVRHLTNDVKWPVERLGGGETDIATINKLTKWAVDIIETVR